MNVVSGLQASAPARVFVVEDEALIAMELLDRLGSLGFEACGHAANGDQALRGIAQAKPDAVLMDIHLGPGLDGIDTARRLKEGHDLPIVFLTAYCDAALIQRAADVDAFGYVLKPFSGRAVRAALAMALARHRAARDLREANAALTADATRSASLHGIVPICMDCRKLRDAELGWQHLEAFLATHTHTKLSHGYCPECARRVFIAHGLVPPVEEGPV